MTLESGSQFQLENVTQAEEIYVPPLAINVASFYYDPPAEVSGLSLTHVSAQFQNRFLYIDVNHFPHAGAHNIPGAIDIWFSRDARVAEIVRYALTIITSNSNEPELQEFRALLRGALVKAIELKQPIEELYSAFLHGYGGILQPNQARLNIYLPTKTTVTADQLITSLFHGDEAQLQIMQETNGIVTNVSGLLTISPVEAV